MYTRSTTSNQSGVLARVVAWIGPKGLLVWALLLVTLGIFAGGLVDLISDLEFGFIFLIVVVAMTTGWLLGVLPIRGWLATLFGIVFGAEFILMRVGRLGDEMADIVRAVFAFAGQLFAWIWERLLYLASYSIKAREFQLTPVRVVDWMTIPDTFGVLWAGIGTLLSRAYAWLAAIFSGSGTFDPVGTALVWGSVVWLCALWAGWKVSRKRQTIVGLLPAGLLLAFLLAYTYAPSGVLLPFLGVLLILIALTGHQERESRWTVADIDFSRDLWSELAVVAVSVSLALVLASAILPTFSYRKLADWIDEMTKRDEIQTQSEEIAKSFGVEQQPAPQPVRPVQQLLRSTDLPRSHLIGSGPELSRVVAFVISTGEVPPLPSEPYMDYEMFDVSVPRHYWRSLTYDRYFGQGWSTSNVELAKYKAGELLLDPEAPNTRVLRQEVRIIGEMGSVVYVDGQLISADQDYEVAWRPPGEVFAATTEERIYRADSRLPVYTVEALRADTTEYPEWLLERYLQLPETTPERVRVLARDLTATQPTPYDRAAAIERYLREEFPYTLDVPRPPAQADIADYFLFELKEGYCDYYATAMVVLARAAGLPARMVVGYVNGRYDMANARYIVTEADAHAWVEVYFPTYGWIEFEPTGGVAPISRPRENEDDLIWPEVDRQPLGPLVPSTEGTPLSSTLLWQWMIAGLLAIVVIVFGVSGIDSVLLLLRRSPEGMATILYNRLRRAGRRLQVEAHEGDTPYEFGSALLLRILEVAKFRRDEELLPPAEDEIPVLVELYVRAWYSPHAILRPERRAAVWAWWKLRWRLWLARLWRKRHKVRAPMPALSEPVGLQQNASV